MILSREHRLQTLPNISRGLRAPGIAVRVTDRSVPARLAREHCEPIQQSRHILPEFGQNTSMREAIPGDWREQR
jgi:hypothetical protein